MYTDTVTVFNKRKTESGDIWYPYILSDVDLVTDRAANQVKTGLENADTARLHVKYRIIDGKMMVGDYQYYPPKEWEGLPDTTRAITFSDVMSFFIRGDYLDTPVPDDDYRDGFQGYLDKTVDDCFKITSIGGPYKLIPHFEIGGR